MIFSAVFSKCVEMVSIVADRPMFVALSKIPVFLSALSRCKGFVDGLVEYQSSVLNG